MQLTKADVRRALVRHNFAPCSNQMEAFRRHRCIQFDPIAPVGCNHDLVLQARVKNYKVGDWEKTAYQERSIYDGWDKMACLIPMEGWPLRRLFHTVHRRWFEQKIFQEHRDAVDTILGEIADRGPLMPKECEFQLRREEWKSSWFGPSVTKQTLRALWHSGLVMTAGRKKGQHLYDLTERIVPKHLFEAPRIPDEEAIRELVWERHVGMGAVRPAAPGEVWSGEVLGFEKRPAIEELVRVGRLAPVDVEGLKMHATSDFLSLLDQPPLEPRVIFVAPLDPFMWDRKAIERLFGFKYSWEIYTPEAKRQWGYYVLPILYGEELVARAEFWCRGGVLELREWHFEATPPRRAFWSALEKSLSKFMSYCGAKETTVRDHIDLNVREAFLSKAA